MFKKTLNKTLKKILIANRGEIASRIIRTCHEQGLETLAIYTPVDRSLPFVREADQSVCLPHNDSLHSYLNAPLILEIAQAYGADAIHPGYGFLSENADFARACQAQGLVFIGPEPDTIAQMGSKIAARQLMQSAGISVVPGFAGPGVDFATAADQIGYPILIKASAGGGGRGMRLVMSPADLKRAMTSAQSEALKAFGDSSLLLEKYLSPVRHIEVQIVGDGKKVWHLLERECSLQRRYQKISEEAPAPNLRAETRQQLYQYALKIGQLLRYKSLGTVEFAVDSEEQIYFLECNTRIQVEHPVTEAITGLDLIALQLQVANDSPLELVQDQIVPQGHAFECRLYAEDPGHDFAPSTGTIRHFKTPQRVGYRCDSGIAKDSQVSIYYDALLAKLIAWGSSRELALARMQRLLKETQIFGVKTNLPLLGAILDDPRLQTGELSTSLIPEIGWQQPTIEPVVSLAALIAYNQLQRSSAPVKSLRAGFRNLPYCQAQAQIEINGVVQLLAYRYDRAGRLHATLDGSEYTLSAITCSAESLSFENQQRYFHFAIAWHDEGREGKVQGLWLHHAEFGNFQAQSLALLRPPETAQSQNAYISQIPGKVLRILVKPGQDVQANQVLLVIESMKMETQILAQTDGHVSGLYVSENQLIEAGALCIDIQ